MTKPGPAASAAAALLGLALAACSGAMGNEAALKYATKEAGTIAAKSFPNFKPIAQHVVPVNKESAPIALSLEEGSCYRLIALRTASSYTEEVKLSFKHSDQVVETGSDFIQLNEKDGEMKKRRAIWGFCVWPGLGGKLTIYTNLKSTGGYLLVLGAPAKKLSFKDGRDVKLFLKGSGVIDLHAMEKKDAEPRLKDILSMDHMSLSGELATKAPAFHIVESTSQPSWQHGFTFEPATCYHLTVASLNCAVKYSVTGVKDGKTLHDDGAPDDVGRSGWMQDFCLDGKLGASDSTIEVRLKMVNEDFENCWFAVALYAWAPAPGEAKGINARAASERKQTGAQARSCDAKRTKCAKTCGKKGKKKTGDGACLYSCTKEYASCTSKIVFEGEMAFVGGS